MHLPSFRKSRGLSNHTTVGLTPLGHTKVETSIGLGMRNRIIELLDQEPKTIGELSRELNTDPSQVEMAVKGLMKSQYVHTIRGEE